jgi:hypothetical protein
MNKKFSSLLIILLILIFVPLTIDAATKTVTGTITSVEGGNGSVGTTVKISLGSNNGLKEGSKGWVTKGDEVIAYIKVVSVNPGASPAVVYAHQNINLVTAGLPVNFKVEVIEEKAQKETPTPHTAPSEVTFAVNPQFDYAWSFSEGLAPVKTGGKWGYIKNPLKR